MKRHIRLNSSALRRGACLRRLQYILNGYHERMVGNDITFGTAFHEFVATLRKNPDQLNEAIAAGWAARNREADKTYTKYRKEYLSDENYFKLVCMYYNFSESEWKTLNSPKTNQPLVELPWIVPFYSGAHIDVSICGTIDDICTHVNNPDVMAIRDYKTTSGTMPDEYFAKYKLSTQLLFYYFGLTEMCKQRLNFPGDNTLAKRWLECENKYVFIEGVFLNPDATKVKFQCSEAYKFTEKMLDEFRVMLWNLCLQLDKPVEEQQPRNGLINAACESEGYGRKCLFFDVCAETEEALQEELLASKFARDTDYNPLTV
jgi:hypothetical protein